MAAAPAVADASSLLTNLLGKELPQRAPGEMVALEGAIDPDAYILGPGDELTIIVWGYLEAEFNVTVYPDGAVVIPTVGSIKVAGYSLTQATKMIIDMIREPYRAEKVTVALAQVRTFLVSIGGAVNSPGTVEIHAGERADAAIREAEGLLFAPKSAFDTTSVLQAAPRLIRIQRKTGETVPVDLILFYRTGEKSANPYLQDGDAVEVPFKEPLGSRIGVFGAFRVPGVYDYTPTDRLSTVVRLSGGLSSASDLTKAIIARFSSDDSTWTEFAVDLEAAIHNPGGEADLVFQPGDRLFVPWKPNWRLLHQVDVDGQVRYPGSYPIVPGRTTLSEVIAEAGGLLPDAALDRSKVIRSLPDREWDHELARLTDPNTRELDPMEKEYRKFSLRHIENQAVVDFEALFVDQNMEQDILLMDGDVIRIPKQVPSVRILGQVMFPGYIRWQPGLTYRDYISRAGGFNEHADRHRARVIHGQTDSWTKATGSIEIHDGDTIFIPEKTWHEKYTTWRYFIEAVAVITQVATLVLVIQNIK